MWFRKTKHNHEPNKIGRYLPFPDCPHPECIRIIKKRQENNTLYCHIKGCKEFAEIVKYTGTVVTALCYFHYVHTDCTTTYPVRYHTDEIDFVLSLTDINDILKDIATTRGETWSRTFSTDDNTFKKQVVNVEDPIPLASKIDWANIEGVKDVVLLLGAANYIPKGTYLITN